MGEIELRSQTDVHASADVIFGALADLRGYDRWLDRSKSFPGISEISPGQITVGTTYVEPDPRGVRRGAVTELDPPKRIAFHQTIMLNPKLLGVIDMDLAYTLSPARDVVHVDRVITIRLPRRLGVARPIVVPRFRREGERILAALSRLGGAAG